MAKFDEVVVIMTKMAGAYPSFALTRPTLNVYAEMLADIPPDTLTAAAKQHMATSRFFPTIAEIREGVISLAELQDRAESPAEAWEWVVQWIGSSGRGRPGGHAIAERAVATIGGWDQLGQGKTEDRPWVMKRFLETYQEFAKRGREDLQLLPDVRAQIEPGHVQAMKRLLGGIGEIPE